MLALHSLQTLGTFAVGISQTGAPPTFDGKKHRLKRYLSFSHKRSANPSVTILYLFGLYRKPC
jgi:hypothetical protein